MVGQHWMTLVVERSAPIPNCLETGGRQVERRDCQLLGQSGEGEVTGFTLRVAGQGSAGLHQQAFISRWSALLACSAVRAFSASLLDRRPVPGLGVIPSVHDVVRDARCV